MGYKLDGLPSPSFSYSNEDSDVNVSGTSSSDNISNTGSNVSINAYAGNDTIKSDGTTFSTTKSVPETVTNYEPVYGYVTEPYIEYETRYRKKSMYIPGYGTGGYTWYYDEPYSVAVTKYRSVYRQTGTRPVQSVVYNDVTTTETIKASYVTIMGGTGDDLISLGSLTDHNLIQYSDGDGFDTVEGFGESDTLQIGNGKGVYSSQTSGSDIIVTVGDGEITIVGAASLSKVNIDGSEKNSWKISGNTATYGNLITISGVASGATASNFYISGKTLTIGKAAVQTNGMPVKLLKGDYTLKLGKGMIESTNVATSYDAKTMTYTAAGKSEGYSLSSDKKSITYNAATSKEFKFSGVASGATASNFYISGKTLTIGKAAVQTNGMPVKLLNQSGYTLKLGKGMTESTNVTTAYNAKTMTYTTAGKTEGYSLSSDKKSISYNSATSKEFKFSGVASGATAANFYIKGNTVTIGKAAVQTNGTPVKLLNQNNYSLKLGKGMTESTNVTTAYNAKTMTYTTAGKTEGYSLSSDKKSISYNSATSKEFKFSGVASGATAANFYIKGNTVTIGKAAVQTNGTPVKLLNQSGYTLKLGKGMEAPTNNAAALKNGVYTFGSKSEGYVLDTKNNTIKYSAATSATLELSGVKSAPTVPTDDTLTLKLTNFDKNLAVTSNTGKYKFSIASGTYTGKTFTGSNGNDTISNAGASLIINSGAGNDSIKSTGANSTINAGAGADTIAGSSGADTLLGDAGNDIIWGGKGNDSILGGAGNDSLSGAAGNDSFWGGAGNDTLIGGAGNDIFIYKPGEGTDHITDYASGDMLKILNADGTNGTFSKAAFADNKLTLTVSGGGNIIFDNVSAGDKINFNGTTKTISGNTLK